VFSSKISPQDLLLLGEIDAISVLGTQVCGTQEVSKDILQLGKNGILDPLGFRHLAENFL